ncbi:MAG: AAA family ATPase [Sporichthyaceae bacterium]
MTRILVTGMSGTGKSAALAALGARGHRVVDTDYDGWSEHVTLPDGSTDWMWREDAVHQLLNDQHGGALFLAGTSRNQGRFYPLLDHVVLLCAPADVLLARIAARDSNPYGKSDTERALVLEHLEAVEPLLRATATLEIDATRPLAEVVDTLEALVTPA